MTFHYIDIYYISEITILVYLQEAILQCFAWFRLLDYSSLMDMWMCFIDFSISYTWNNWTVSFSCVAYTQADALSSSQAAKCMVDFCLVCEISDAWYICARDEMYFFHEYLQYINLTFFIFASF
jgi:hypothetical protein